ncbi:MAG: hypothetical protein IV086_01715 [Hyphomonadaceae bacterium]|nr:MAG: hypothetical protein FD160_1124 [Caulobacteraceae bacterium]MBT9444396.1 hypothetical protein [Hyphomonadaceae bacterium]
MTMEPVWRESLLAAARRDLETRERLVRDGSLFDGYHPEMEAVHLENAALLDEAFRTIGWPGRHRVDDDGAAAAFLILQHAISRPDVQRLGLALMLEAIPLGDANMIDAAYLSDRIAVFEGRPQLYGTQFDWFDGALSPSPIEAPEQVEERRASVGLPPLADVIAMQRDRAASEGQTLPTDLAARQAAFDVWARRVGWRT